MSASTTTLIQQPLTAPPYQTTFTHTCDKCGADLTHTHPGIAEDARRRISELETQVKILTGKATAAGSSSMSLCYPWLVCCCILHGYTSGLPICISTPHWATATKLTHASGFPQSTNLPITKMSSANSKPLLQLDLPHHPVPPQPAGSRRPPQAYALRFNPAFPPSYRPRTGALHHSHRLRPPKQPRPPLNSSHCSPANKPCAKRPKVASAKPTTSWRNYLPNSSPRRMKWLLRRERRG